MPNKWEKIKFDLQELEEYQLQISHSYCLRVWKDSNNKWAMDSMGRWVDFPVDSLDDAKHLCEQFAISLLKSWLNAIEQQ